MDPLDILRHLGRVGGGADREVRPAILVDLQEDRAALCVEVGQAMRKVELI
jgi:hypothetical protein